MGDREEGGSKKWILGKWMGLNHRGVCLRISKLIHKPKQKKIVQKPKNPLPRNAIDTSQV